jgi:hypothetical protein
MDYFLSQDDFENRLTNKATHDISHCMTAYKSRFTEWLE